MQTEILNQFIFADLLEKVARRLRAEHALSKFNVPEPISMEDLREAYEHLLGLRMDMLNFIDKSEDLEVSNK